jgi:mono/diheme cytochrome c family protein
VDDGAGLKELLGIAIAASALGAAYFGLTDTEGGAIAQPAVVDSAAGEQLYAQNCASCHGADLEGQGDWRVPGADGRLPAPPHDETGHTWHHSDAVLFTYVAVGGREALAEQGMEFDSGMPGFEGTLTEQEIWNILAYIKSTWPDREREVQAARSAEQ